jgi:FAD/FMN-containing dehydrogenase/Fe-S oxidoreductase
MTIASGEVRETIARLRKDVRGSVSDAQIKKAEYSTDASNYRVLPEVVVTPIDSEDLATILEIAHNDRVPVTLRGGGTSIAGNSIGTGIVIDTSVHMNKILDLDPVNGTAIVQPGVILSSLQSAAAPHGLRFGPDPSTQNRATLGGLIGNNSCGPHALHYGKTAENVISLDLLDGRLRKFTAEKGFDSIPGLQQLVSKNLAVLRTEFGKFGRQVSGYTLEHLLPENGSNLAAALTGTEGTLATILQAKLRLVPQASAPALVILGYATMPDAGDDVPNLLKFTPLAMEGLDIRLIEVARQHWKGKGFPELPKGQGWLMIEVGGNSPEEAVAQGKAIAQASHAIDSRVLPAGPEAKTIWELRADSSGYAGRTASGNQAWPGWEDAAVPPANLGTYMREMEQLMARHKLEGVPFGHFGDGCIHVRIDFPLDRETKTFRTFVESATDIVLRLGGSPSGEHGDGRARSEMLTRMYSPAAITMFEELKEIFDPLNILNPGVIVKPRRIDQDLRRPTAVPIARAGGFSFGEDGGDFTNAVHRCVGVGKCRADSTSTGGFMCPSYLATKDESLVTRGRARVLQELTQQTGKKTDWSSSVVEESLDMCLSCKACASDCPAEVDMAKYKSEVLYRRYKGKIRPISHYILGWLPRWSALVQIAPGVVNAATQSRIGSKMALLLGGMDSKRSLPRFAQEPFLKSQKKETLRTDQPQILLWVDSFTDSFTPTGAQAAKELLEHIGYQVLIPDEAACCGLTWISTGQLDGAKKRLTNLLRVLSPYVEQGMEIVGLEPSCTAVLRSDLLDLLPQDPRAIKVAEATRTVAEVISRVPSNPKLHWKAPDLSDMNLVVQPHCHQHAVMGFRDDQEVLQSTGITFKQLAGCCGLAGNFGMERGHYDLSVAVAENALLPALRARDRKTVFLADGFSCRTQAEQLEGVEGITLAQLLMSAIKN